MEALKHLGSVTIYGYLSFRWAVHVFWPIIDNCTLLSLMHDFWGMYFWRPLLWCHWMENMLSQKHVSRMRDYCLQQKFTTSKVLSELAYLTTMIFRHLQFESWVPFNSRSLGARLTGPLSTASVLSCLWDKGFGSLAASPCMTGKTDSPSSDITSMAAKNTCPRSHALNSIAYNYQ